MKSLTAGINTAINTIKGNEPLIVLGIDWGNPVGAFFYADKEIRTPVVMQGRILQLSDLSIVRHQDNFGEISSCSVTLSDHDLHFWQIMNQTNLEGKNVVVWQHFPNSDSTELLCLFIGNIVAPITWSEGQKTLSFSIFTNHNDKNVGTSFTTEDLEDDIGLVTVLDKNAIGAKVPLAFGNCLKTKTLKTFTGRQSTLLENIFIDDTINYVAYKAGIPYLTQDVQVEEGDQWPQGVIVDFTIDDLRFQGIFNGTTLTITDNNIPTDLQSAITYRDPTDPDYMNFSVVWIPTTQQLVNKWIWFRDDTHGNVVNYCTNQNGNKCTFQQPFIKEFRDPSDIDNPFVFLMNGALAFQAAVKYYYGWPALGDYLLYYENYTIPIGSTLIATTNETYIANELPGCNIKNAYAYRNIPNEIYNPELDQYEQRGSTRKLCIIPSSYYSIDAIDFTALVFNRKLSSYHGEYWDDGQIFVTQNSTVGPNTADIIRWILENYTLLAIDTPSFDSVATKIDKYPSNFCLHESKKAIELCRDIAWQARCALRIYNGTAYLIYLSEFPSVVATLNADKIQYKSLEVMYSDTERMYTRAKAKFLIPSFINTVKEEQTYIFDSNIDIYGLKEVQWDFFIYDNKDYVRKSTIFWLNYYSNSWKKIKLKGFLNSVNLELFDCVYLSFATVYPLGLNVCKGIIEEWMYNSENFTIDMIFWTPMLAGTQFETNIFWPDDGSDGLSFVDLTSGISLTDYVVTLDSKNRKHPNKYVKIKSVEDELDKDGNPITDDDGNDLKNYTAETMSYGPENSVDGSTVSGIRAVDPAQTAFLPNDVVKVSVIGKVSYLTNKTNDIVAFKFLTMYGDYIAAYPADMAAGTIVFIAKPYNLRRTPFDGNTINGITYAYSDDFTRTATDIHGNVETQKVTPDYYTDGVIHAMRNIRGQDVLDDDGKPVKWLQTDVYQWAVDEDA